MKPSKYFGRAIVRLFILFVVCLAVFSHSSAQSPPCLTALVPQPVCKNSNGSACVYSFTINLKNNYTVAGTITVQSSVGTVNLVSNPPIAAGGNSVITGDVTVPCGTTAIILTSSLAAPNFICGVGNHLTLPPCAPPTQCAVTLPTYSCSKDSNGNPIYSIQFNVTHSLGCPANLTITSSSGTVQPSTFSNVTSGSTYSFALFNPTSNPIFTFNLTGCGLTCKTTAQLQSLPANCGLCTSLWLPTVSACTGIVNGLCQYPFTIKVGNNNDVAGVVALTSSVGTVNVSNPNVSPGGSTISGTLSVPCGTTSVTLTEQLALGGATAPQTCNANLTLPLPPPCSTQCAATFPAVTCVKNANGNAIYNITSNVTNNLGCPANLQITSSSGVVQPTSFPNVASGGSVSFTLFGATTNPNFTFTWSGCGKTCTITTKLPNGLPTICGDCLSVAAPNLSACTGIVNGLCQYTFTLNVTNNTNSAGVFAVSSSVGTVTTAPSSLNPGSNTISGTLSVPCGTSATTFTGVLTLPGNPALPPQTCKTTFAVQVPPPCPPPTTCAVTFPTVSCVKDANGNPIYNITSNVTNNLGCPANLQITTLSGVVIPNSFSNVTSGSSVSFSLFGATTNPNLTFSWSGCGKTCTVTAKLPHGLPTNCGDCLSFRKNSVGTCTGVSGGTLCQYPFTISVKNNTNDPGTLTLTPTVGTVTPASFNVNPGVNTISGTLSVPCGTSSVTLNGLLTLSGNPALPPRTCKSAILITVPPPCVCEVKATKDQTICKGGSTQVDLPGNTPGTILWYYSSPCVAPIPPSGIVPAGWLPMSGGTTWYTLNLDQTTCYQAVITNMPNCPSPVVSNPVTVTVIEPCSGSITCKVGSSACPADGKLCSGSVVNLAFVGASSSCKLQWQQWNGSLWVNIPGATSPTLLPQTLTSPASACPFTIRKFRVVCSCPPCPTAYPEISFSVYNPSQVGTLVAKKPTICEGDDDVVTLSSKCGDVTKWELSTTGPTAGFNTISGSGGATTWWTNKLYQDTWYRVTVKNGPCAAVTSAAVKITVTKKPKVTVTPPGPLKFCAPGSVVLTATGTPGGGSYQWYLNGLPAPPVATNSTYVASVSGNYYVVYSTPPCGKAKSNLVKVKVSKVVAVIEGACGVCLPGCVNLQAVAAGGVAPYTFFWLNNGFTGPIQSVCPATNTTYTVKVTDAIGCSTTATHTVTICKKPVVANAGQNVSINLGGSAVLGGTPTASGGTGPYTYSWSPTAGLSNAAIANPKAKPSQTTTYTVTVTDANGCVNTSTVTVTVH
jgi:hypothetical protein